MKNLFKSPIAILYLIVLVSCSTDDTLTVSPNLPPEIANDFYDDMGKGIDSSLLFYFKFLAGEDSETYIDMPIESSSTNLFVGRWKITQHGVDYDNNGKLDFSENYEDRGHNDCGISILQFNNDGVVFENIYNKYKGACKISSQFDNWKLIAANRLKIGCCDNIYVVKVSESELILKYDYDIENSCFSPMQIYYYYERILPSD